MANIAGVPGPKSLDPAVIFLLSAAVALVVVRTQVVASELFISIQEVESEPCFHAAD